MTPTSLKSAYLLGIGGVVVIVSAPEVSSSADVAADDDAADERTLAATDAVSTVALQTQ